MRFNDDHTHCWHTLLTQRFTTSAQNDLSLYSNTDTFSNDFVQRIHWLAGHRSVPEKNTDQVGTGFGERGKIRFKSAEQKSWNVLRMIWEVRGDTWSYGKAARRYAEVHRAPWDPWDPWDPWPHGATCVLWDPPGHRFFIGNGLTRVRRPGPPPHPPRLTLTLDL